MSKTCCGGTEKPAVKIKPATCCSGSAVPSRSACCAEKEHPPEEKSRGSVECASLKEKWIAGTLSTPAGEIPLVKTKLVFSDRLGSWKCRWSIGRMDYKVEPGLYGVGSPDASSPVLVTSNYKMTFDRLREQLVGLNLWIVVLDTDGVNVWCAAGKGTFGTDELVRRIATVRLSDVVSHRTVILPQLGAVGVAAHEAAKRSGFRVLIGPVRASDIRAFLAAGMRATEEMRTVRFTLINRIVLTPMELVGALKPLLIAFGVLFLLNAVGFGYYGWPDLYGMIGAILVGAVVAPILLPWIPGRAFSFKGALLGLAWAVGFLFLNGLPAVPAFGWLKAAAYLLLLPSLSGFLTMNFTGSSTFTSLSGVDAEMKVAVPVMLFAAAGALALLLTGDFIRLFGGGVV